MILFDIPRNIESMLLLARAAVRAHNVSHHIIRLFHTRLFFTFYLLIIVGVNESSRLRLYLHGGVYNVDVLPFCPHPCGWNTM